MTLDSALHLLQFSKSEIVLYKQALQLGIASKEELITITGQSKLTFEASANALIEKSLLTKVQTNATFQYSAEKPEKLVAYAKDYLQSIQSAISTVEDQQPVLEGSMADEKPIVRFFEGKQGLKSMLNEFNQMQGDEALLFYSPENVHEIFSEEELANQQTKFIQKKISARSICFSHNPELRSTENVEKFFVDKTEFPFDLDLEVYDNKVAIASLGEQKHGVIIESESIARAFKQIHKLAELGALSLQKKKG